MSCFAIYRLPHAQECTLVEQTDGLPEQLQSCTELNGRAGFVLAPFQITPDSPLLLIRPDRTEQLSVSQLSSFDAATRPLLPCNEALLAEQQDACCHATRPYLPCNDLSVARQYASDYARFHRELREDRFEKLVLSRCLPLPNDGSRSPFALFRQACELYPRLFICLVSTPQSGTWLTATPEILLEGTGNRWRTIALAGTMQLSGDALRFDMPPGDRGSESGIAWSTKNIQEQRYVATYMAEQLKPFVGDLHEEGPRTVRAASLVHLRSDFTFTLFNNARVGDVLQALHPTPAVCGLPKQQAIDFIMANEHTPRLYYSGFMGPLHTPHSTLTTPHSSLPTPHSTLPTPHSPLLTPHSSLPTPHSTLPTPQETHLYVTLRCMQITPSCYKLYAGGGLLPDSVEEQEWLETEAKLQNMQQLLNPHV